MSVARCIDDLVRAVNDEFTIARARRCALERNDVITKRDIRNLEDEERDLILLAVAQCEGNPRRAAALLGIGKTTIYRKLKEYRYNGK